jgi:hypothetical protein
MNFKEVVLTFQEKNFIDTGLPVYKKINTVTAKLNPRSEGLKRVIPFTKENRQYKQEWQDFAETSSIVTNVSWNVFNDKNPFIEVTNDGVTLRLFVFNGKVKTFKFFGMDITDNLDVVIKGSMGMILVGNLSSEVIFKEKEIPDISQRNAANSSINFETIKLAVENLKLKNLYSLPNEYRIVPDTRNDAIELTYNTYGGGNQKDFTFADHIVKEISTGRDVLSSIIIKYSSKTGVEVNKIDEKDMSRLVYARIGRSWSNLVDKYKIMSRVISAFDLFLSLHKKLYGVNETIDKVKKSIVSGEFGDIGCLEGYSRDDSIESRTLHCDLSSEFLISISKLNEVGKATLKHPITRYMMTMFDVPNSVDISKIRSRETCLSYSVIDALKYIDDDLIMVAKQYNMNNDDEKELFLKNVITGYKQKFSGYMKESNVDIDDEIINNILPQDINPVDILNVSKKEGLVGVNTDIEVSRASFNKTNLMICSKLIEKILKSVLKSFPSKK